MLIRRLLVPVDFSDRSRSSLQYAFQLAELARAEVDLLHVVSGPGMARAVVDAYVGRPMPQSSPSDVATAHQDLQDLINICARRGIVPRVVVEAGDVASTIVGIASEAPADLIVLATRGHRGIGELILGSVAHAVITTASCPVVTLGEAVTRWLR